MNGVLGPDTITLVAGVARRELAFFIWRHEDLTRREAAVLIASFVAYLVVRNALFPEDAPLG